MTAFLLLRVGTDKHPFTAFCSADVVAKSVRKPSYWQAVAVVCSAQRLFFCAELGMSKNGDTHGAKFRRQLIQTVIHPSSSLGVHQKPPVSTDFSGKQKNGHFCPFDD
jgi:hypothetical protein